MFKRCTLVFLLLPCFYNAQEGLEKQKLLRLLQEDPADSTRIDIYNELAWPVYSYEKPDSSIYYAEEAIKLSAFHNDRLRESVAQRRLGITYLGTGKIKESIRHQEKSLRLSEEIGYREGMLLALNNIGVAYLNNELLNTALEYFLRCLKLVEETNDYSSAANLYTNCGMIYRRTGDLVRSKEFFIKARNYAVKGDSDMQVIANSNLSTAYRMLEMPDSAEYYLDKAEVHVSEKTSAATIFKYHLTRAMFKSSVGQNEEALKQLLAMKPQVRSPGDEVTLIIHIAEEYQKTGKLKLATEHLKKAFVLSEEHRMFNNLEYVSLLLSNLYESRGELKDFAFYMRKHIAYRDSNEQLSKNQAAQRQQLEYDYKRRHLADSIAFQQKEYLSNLELAAAEGRLLKARNTRILLVTIMVILTAVALFVMNRFFIIRRQKQTIESQKQLVELKNEEILDSINYAKRLQSAILPQIAEIREAMNADVLYMPKDIIGGDFYFFEKFKNRIFFAISDCTGHGVPGALMSVVCYEALEKSIRNYKLRQPAEILNKSRDVIIENLNASEQNIKDGMDCSLLVIDLLKETIQWSGANNGIWIIKNNELQEIKADKQPVAFYEGAK